MIGFDEYSFAAGTVRGFRAWPHKDAYHRLIGRYGGWWYPGENTATCHNGTHAWNKTPVEDCRCGFWAYWDTPHGKEITGIVEGYGRTLIGEKGFRCQKARILALAAGDPLMRRSLAEVYQVPVYRTSRQLMRHWQPEGAPPLSRRRWLLAMASILLTVAYPVWGVLTLSGPWWNLGIVSVFTGWMCSRAELAVRLLRHRQAPWKLPSWKRRRL